MERSIPTTEFLCGNIPAPTAAEIVASDSERQLREADLLFAARTPYLDRLPGYYYSGGSSIKVIAVTEADALVDLETRMQALHEILGEQSLIKFFNELRFIGQREFSQAVDAIARHWLNRINSSASGELLVGYQTDTSSAYVYTQVLSRLQDMDPAAAAQIIPFQASHIERQIKPRLVSSAAVIVDDWAITGMQMRSTIGYLSRYMARDNLEVNLICATDDHLKEGVDSGVRTLSYFVRPQSDNLRNDRTASITGAHSETDFGFNNTLETFYNMLRRTVCFGRANAIPYPLLFKIAKAYKPEETKVLTEDLTAEQLEELRRRQQRCAAALVKLANNRTRTEEEPPEDDQHHFSIPAPTLPTYSDHEQYQAKLTLAGAPCAINQCKSTFPKPIAPIPYNILSKKNKSMILIENFQ